MNRITLAKMAKRLGRCKKTFHKHVKLYNIPHIKLGRSMLFDAEQVETYLASQPQATPRRDLPKPAKRGSKNRAGRFVGVLNA